MPTETIPGIARPYRVSYPAHLTAEDARAVVDLLEREGKLPYRSFARGAAAIQLGSLVVRIREVPYDIVICEETVGIIPRDGQG